MATRSFISVVMATLPALTFLAEHLRVGDPNVVEEDLVELGFAGDLVERSNLDAGRFMSTTK